MPGKVTAGNSEGQSANRPDSKSSASAPSPWPTLVPMGHHAGKSAIPLMRPVTLVGSRTNAHLHLLSRSVSKCHALILSSDGRVYIRDLCSRTHVLVNGRKVREADLVDRDSLQIGSFEFQYRAPAGSKQRPRPDQASPAALHIEGQLASLEVTQRVLLMGHRGGADVPLVGESVSTCHAVLFSMNGKRYIRDLGSRTGTFVNGSQEKQVELRWGDTIRIGQTTMRLENAAPPGSETLDELEDLIGTAPLIPSGSDVVPPVMEFNRPMPPLATPLSKPVSRPSPPPMPSIPEPKMPVIDLDLDPDVSGPGPLAGLPSPHETARLPVEDVEPPTPIPAISKEVHDESDLANAAPDEKGSADLLVGPNLLRESLSSSSSGHAMQEVVRESHDDAPVAPPVPVSEPPAAVEPIAEPPVIESPIELPVVQEDEEPEALPEIIPVAEAPWEHAAEPVAPAAEVSTPIEPTAAAPVVEPEPAVEAPAPPKKSRWSRLGLGRRRSEEAAAARVPPPVLPVAEPIVESAVEPVVEPVAEPVVEAVVEAAPEVIPPTPVPTEFAEPAELPVVEPAMEIIPPPPAAPVELEAPPVIEPALEIIPPPPAEPVELESPPLVEPALEMAPPIPAALLAEEPLPVTEDQSVVYAPAALEAVAEVAPAIDVPPPAPQATDLVEDGTTAVGQNENPIPDDLVGLIFEEEPATPAVAASVEEPTEPVGTIVTAPMPFESPAPVIEPVAAAEPELAPVEPVEAVEFAEPVAAVAALPEPESAPVEPVETIELVLPAEAPVAEVAEPPAAELAEPEAAVVEESEMIEFGEPAIGEPVLNEPALNEPIASGDAPQEPPPPAASDAASEVEPPPPSAPSAVEPPAAASTVSAAPAEPATVQVVAPLPGLGIAGVSSTTNFFSSDHGSFLGGMPLQLQELTPAPPTFGRVQVTFGDQAESLRAAVRKSQEEETGPRESTPGQPGAAPVAPSTPYDQVKVDMDADAPPAPGTDAPVDDSAQGMLDRSKEFLRKQQGYTAIPRPRMEKRNVPAASAGELGDINLYEQTGAPGGGTPAGFGMGFGQQTIPFGAVSAPLSEVDVFGGGLSQDLSKDPFFGSAVKEAPARAGRKPIKTPVPVKQPIKPVASVVPASPAPRIEEPADDLGDSTVQAPFSGDPIAGNKARDEMDADFMAAPVALPEGSLASELSPADPTELRPGLLGAPNTVVPRASGRPGVQGRSMPMPQAAPPRRSRKGVGLLLLIMAVLTAASLTWIYFHFRPPRSSVQATFKYTLGPKVTDPEWLKFKDQQIRLMSDENTRGLAAEIFAARPAVYSPGFLADKDDFAKDRALAENTPGVIHFVYQGTDAVADEARVKALAEAFEKTSANYDLRAKADGNRDSLKHNQSELFKRQEKLKEVTQKLEGLDKLAASPVTAASIQSLQDKQAEAQRGFSDADKAVTQLKAEMAQSEPAANPPSTAPSEAVSSADAGSDSTPQKLQMQLSDLNQRIAAAQARRVQDDAESRKPVDTAMGEVQQVLQKAQGFKDGGSMAAYVDAARALQETTGKFTTEFLDGWQKRNAALVELKKSLDDKMEARRMELWATDPELKKLMDDLNFRQHGYRAAVDQGMPKEADEMQHQIEQAQQRIAERKRKIGDDMGLAGIALQLQEEIDKNQKQLDADRLRIEQMLADSQKQFAEAAPKVEKLPEEQKAFVAELSAKVETVNTARMEYAKAVTARNDEADKTIADLESQRKTLAAQIDDHSRLVLEQRKSDYATAVAAKTKADAALQQANTALAEARGNDDQARVAQSLNTEKVTLASDVEVLKQQVNQQQQDVDEAIYLEPADSSVRVIQQNQKDKRPMYAGFTCAAIFLLFGALILRALSSRPAGLALTGLNLAPITTGRRAASSAAGNGAAAKPVEPNVPIQEHSAIA